MVEEETNVQNHASKWCQGKHIHRPHVWAAKEEDGQLYSYYCHGTWEEFKEE